MKLSSQLKDRIILILFLAAFLYISLERIIGNFGFTYVPFANHYSLILTGMLCCMWVLTILRRVTERRTCLLTVFIIGMLLLNIVFRICRYSLVLRDSAFYNVFWYAYYIPQTLLPLFIFFIALQIRTTIGRRVSVHYYLLIIPAVLLITLFLTNDLHGLAFHFTDAAHEHSTHGIVYYAFLVWFSVLLLLALLSMIDTARAIYARRLIWLPIAPILLGAALFLDDLTFGFLRVNGVPPYNSGTTFAFMIIGFLEGCIRIGLLPSNDISGIFRLSDAAEMSMAEAMIREKGLQTQAVNALYDHIAETIRPESEQIKLLLEQLSDDDDVFKKQLAEISVYNAYIKRRSNLELLKSQQALLPIRELFLSISESLVYLHLTGMEVFLSPVLRGDLPADMLITAYAFFEHCAENALTGATDLMVNIGLENDTLTMRILYSGAREPLADFPARLLPANGSTVLTRDPADQSAVLVLKGGDNK